MDNQMATRDITWLSIVLTEDERRFAVTPGGEIESHYALETLINLLSSPADQSASHSATNQCAGSHFSHLRCMVKPMVIGLIGLCSVIASNFD